MHAALIPFPLILFTILLGEPITHQRGFTLDSGFLRQQKKEAPMRGSILCIHPSQDWLHSAKEGGSWLVPVF